MNFSIFQICFDGEENYSKNYEIDPNAEKKFLQNLRNASKNPLKYLIGEDKSTKSDKKK